MSAFVPIVLTPLRVASKLSSTLCLRRKVAVRALDIRRVNHAGPKCAIGDASDSGEHKQKISNITLRGDESSESSFAYALFATACAALTAPSVALAAEAETTSSLKSLLTSMPFNLAHPTVMWILLFTSLYALNLGWQSRQIRSAEPERRKELVKSKVTQRHFITASTLFAIMTTSTFLGMGNTYLRTGKLFPGPHLYVGLSLVTLMAVTSSLVPYMQQGKDWAKNIHLAVGLSVVGLFGWQAKSGMAIVAKLLHWD